jgi:hypothetical protein
MRLIVFPDDALLRNVFGSGLHRDPRRAERAYRARLLRAQERGVLPPKVYVSPRRFGWDRAELEVALANLPRSYAGFARALATESQSPA